MSTFTKILLGLIGWNTMLWWVLGLLFTSLLPGGWWTIAILAALALAPVAVLARGFTTGGYPRAFTRIWIFRPFWYGQLFLPLLAAAGIVGAAIGLVVGAPGQGGRIAVGAMATIIVVGAIAGYLGSRRLVTRSVEIAFPDLPGGLDGLRIVQLSDLHVGPHTPARHLERVVEAVRAARPDLLVLTGDQVDDFARDVEPLGQALGEISAPLGVVAIAGNHDVYAGWGAVRRGMERLGWKVLVNESITIERRGARVRVVGLGDPAGFGGPSGTDPSVIPDVNRALAGIGDDEFTLALAHNPVLWPALADRGVRLTLSGHTHYGQLAIPRLEWSMASPFLQHAMGMHRDGASTLYINPGTNYWGIPFRLGTPPEVTVVTLVRAPASTQPQNAVPGTAKEQPVATGPIADSR